MLSSRLADFLPDKKGRSTLTRVKYEYKSLTKSTEISFKSNPSFLPQQPSLNKPRACETGYPTEPYPRRASAPEGCVRYLAASRQEHHRRISTVWANRFPSAKDKIPQGRSLPLLAHSLLIHNAMNIAFADRQAHNQPCIITDFSHHAQTGTRDQCWLTS